MKIISHRGRAKLSHSNPDNSVAAFNAALRDGFDGVELDLRSSKDNISLCHDSCVSDSQGQGLRKKFVKDICHKDIIRPSYSISESADPWTKTDDINDLVLLLESRSQESIFNLEVKDIGTLKKVSDKLKLSAKINFKNIYFSSFLHDEILFGNRIPEAKYGILLCAGMNYGAFVSIMDHYHYGGNFDFIVLEHEFSNVKEIEYIKSKGMESWTYGVPEALTYSELREEGWDAIITDYSFHSEERKNIR